MQMKRRRNRDIEKIYSKKEFIAKLRRLADALEDGKPARFQVKGERLTIPPDAALAIEHEREGTEEEIEFSLVWKRER